MDFGFLGGHQLWYRETYNGQPVYFKREQCVGGWSLEKPSWKVGKEPALTTWLTQNYNKNTVCEQIRRPLYFMILLFKIASDFNLNTNSVKSTIIRR